MSSNGFFSFIVTSLCLYKLVWDLYFYCSSSALKIDKNLVDIYLEPEAKLLNIQTEMQRK